MSSAPREEDLRAAKEGSLQALADQAREIGALPRSETLERFVEPIIHKLDVDMTAEAGKSVPRPSDAEHDAQLAQQRGGSVETTRTPAAAVKFLPDGSVHVQFAPGVEIPGLDGTPETRRLRERARMLMTLPEWKARFARLFAAKLPPRKLELSYRKLIAESNRAFGDWRKTRDPALDVLAQMGWTAPDPS
jgi:hypothetical protein